jgi:hypothetical protein
MSMTEKELMNLQKVGRIAKLIEKKKELDLENQKFYAPEYPVINSGRSSDIPTPLKNQISSLAELAQVIKQSRETQYQLSQNRGLFEQKQTEFFEKQAQPVVKSIEESKPEDNTDQLKEIKSRLMKAGLPLENVLALGIILDSIVESVDIDDKEADKMQMLNEYYIVADKHIALKGYDELFKNVLNEYFGVTSTPKVVVPDVKPEAKAPEERKIDAYEKYINNAKRIFTGLNIAQTLEILAPDPRLNETERELIVKFLITKGIIKNEMDGDDETKAVESTESEIVNEALNNWKNIVFVKLGKKGRKINRRGAVEDKIETWLSENYKTLNIQQKNKLLWEIINQIKDEPEYLNLKPSKKGEKQSILDRRAKLGFGLAGRGFSSDIAKLGNNFNNNSIIKAFRQAGRGLQFENMEPKDLLHNLGLNIASQKAGNTGVGDVINTIIDEMFKRKIVSKPEHKKLWYQFCD